MSKTFEVRLEGLELVEEFLRSFPSRTTTELGKALQYSALLIQRLARQEAPVDRGQLRASINYEQTPDSVTVFSGVKYAAYVHEGTGIYGPSKQPISPTNAKVLAWRSGGKQFFARSVKGIKPNPFMSRAIEQAAPQVLNAFDAAIDRVMEGKNG